MFFRIKKQKYLLFFGFSYKNQQNFLEEDSRPVSEITSINSVNTVLYYGPGNTDNDSLLRPVKWCKQTEDKIINQKD